MGGGWTFSSLIAKEITQRCGRLPSGEQALSGGTRQFLLKQDLGRPQAVAQDAACFCMLLPAP